MNKHDRDRSNRLQLEWAEENTLLSVARTYGSWTRTGMASLGVALGMRFVFQDPAQLLLGQVIATLFIAIAVALFIAGNVQAHQIQDQLEAEYKLPFRNRYWPITLALSVSSALILLLMWKI